VYAGQTGHPVRQGVMNMCDTYSYTSKISCQWHGTTSRHSFINFKDTMVLRKNDRLHGPLMEGGRGGPAASP
jgi:hypothetical protein